jgi:hypothetical protein
VDAVVHALDIRRPLGSAPDISPDAFRPAADFCVKSRRPASTMVGGSVRRRIDGGLRLVADGLGWSWVTGKRFGPPARRSSSYWPGGRFDPTS